MDSRRQDVERIIVLSGRAAIDVPTPLTRGATALARVALSARNRPEKLFGIWDFPIVLDARTPRLNLSPARLDQCFITLDHPGHSPIASHYELYSLPEQTEDFALWVTVRSAQDQVQHVYNLSWPSRDLREQHIGSWKRNFTPPVQWFYVEITTVCNLSCQFCPSAELNRPRASMTTEMADKIFRSISDYLNRRDLTYGYSKVNRMIFLHVMGEPLIHPKLVELVLLAKGYGLEPALFTNATLLNKKAIDKIFACNLSHITLSVNAATDEGYRALGARDRLHDQERRICNLLKERSSRRAFELHVDIQYIASAGRMVAGPNLVETRNQVWDLIRKWLPLVRDLEIARSYEPDPVSDIDPALLQNPLTLQVTDPSLRIPLGCGVNLVIKSGCSFGNTRLPNGLKVVPALRGKCPFNNPFQQMAIFVDGSVSFCNLDHENSVCLGNISEQTIEQLWSGARMREIRANMNESRLIEPLCQKCLGSVIQDSSPVNASAGPN